VAVIALCLPATASARPREGRLDLDFGKHGLAMTSPVFRGEEPDVELTVEGGSVVVADGLEGTAIRFRANGSWDRRFGEDGTFAIQPGAALGGGEDLRFFPDSITVDHRGRVLVFGTRLDTSRTTQGPEGLPVSASLTAVLRYEADERPDPSFGEGKGYVVGNFGLAPEAVTGLPRIGALTGRVDAADRPLFVLSAAGRVGGCYGKGTVGPVPRGLVRLTTTGRPDSSFGGGDGVSPLFGSGESPGLGLATRDRPVVGTGNVGSYAAECGEGGILFRFRRDGRRMNGFGSHGERAFGTGHLAVVEPSGATILGEPRGTTLEVTRVRSDGVRDGGFGRAGISRIRLPSIAGLHVEPAAVDRRGRVLLAGYVDSAETDAGRRRASRSSFVVARLLADGKIDRSFGRHGWIFTRLPRGVELSYADATLDPQGRLLVGGIVRNADRGDAGFAMVRYLLGS
jgi:uncharacterized delta-60 repeat protein